MRRATPLALILTACLGLSAGGDQSGTRAPATGSAAAGSQPLDAYDMTPAETRTVNTARWTLAARCMRGLGFGSLRGLDPARPPAWPRRPADGTKIFALVIVSDAAHRYGVQDPEEAAAHGYRGPAAAYEHAAPDRKWTLPEYLALTGAGFGDDPTSVHGHRIPAQGCLGQADRRIYGTDRRAAPDPFLTLLSESRRQAREDPAWKHADRTWSACMSRAGYHYATPQDAQKGDDRLEEELRRRLLGDGRAPDEPSDPEKRTAVADARCKLRTGYVPAVHAADVRAQRRVIAGHRAELDRIRERNRAAARNARAIVRNGS
ncbi:hypothetical protein [Streptomyces sp. NRRL S-340]|uniref:hypothetical protein n=1 Tax=Streptomyces sp. NRRL S-340 TaxID=1463901 RepID=UPI00055A4DC6|nr:hypothetical protein [Streptomyces sp. NRRL S-340]